MITLMCQIQPVHNPAPHSPACSYLLCKCHFCHIQVWMKWDRTALAADQKRNRHNYHLVASNNNGLMLCFAGFGEWLSLRLPPWLLWSSLWAQCFDVYRFSVLQWRHMLGKRTRSQLHLCLPFWFHGVKLWKKSRQVHKQPMCKWWVFLIKK